MQVDWMVSPVGFGDRYRLQEKIHSGWIVFLPDSCIETFSKNVEMIMESKLNERRGEERKEWFYLLKNILQPLMELLFLPMIRGRNHRIKCQQEKEQQKDEAITTRMHWQTSITKREVGKYFVSLDMINIRHTAPSIKYSYSNC